MHCDRGEHAGRRVAIYVMLMFTNGLIAALLAAVIFS